MSENTLQLQCCKGCNKIEQETLAEEGYVWLGVVTLYDIPPPPPANPNPHENSSLLTLILIMHKTCVNLEPDARYQNTGRFRNLGFTVRHD